MRATWSGGGIVLGLVLACGGASGPSEPALADVEALKPVFDVPLAADAPQLASTDHFGLVHANGAVLTFLSPVDGAVVHTQTLDCDLDLRGLDSIGFKGLHVPCTDGTARTWTPSKAPTEATGRPLPPPDFTAADDRQAWTSVAPAAPFTRFTAYGGPDGVDLFDGSHWIRRLDVPDVSAVATDGHGSLFIATSRGVVGYHGSLKPTPPTSLTRALARAATKPAGTTGPPGSAPPSLELEATLTRSSGDTLTLKRTSGPDVASGTKATLSTFVEKTMFGAQITMWLTIAEVEVTRVAGDTLTVKVLEEKSETMVDGKKVDRFTSGARTKLIWAK